VFPGLVKNAQVAHETHRSVFGERLDNLVDRIKRIPTPMKSSFPDGAASSEGMLHVQHELLGATLRERELVEIDEGAGVHFVANGGAHPLRLLN
jgi:hypothetical protein